MFTIKIVGGHSESFETLTDAKENWRHATKRPNSHDMLLLGPDRKVLKEHKKQDGRGMPQPRRVA